MKRRTKRTTGIVAASLLLLAAVSVVLYIERPKPPLDAIWAAEDALRDATAAGARHHAPEMIRNAEDSLRIAQDKIETEGKRLYFLRDYAVTLRCAESAWKKCIEAQRLAHAAVESLSAVATQTIFDAASMIAHGRTRLAQCHPEPKDRTQLEKLDVSLEESRRLFDQGRYQESIQVARDALAASARFDERIQAKLDHYLGASDRWAEWATEAIDWSRETGQPAVVVQKLDHVCALYVRGVRVKRYKVDLGRRWMQDKVRQGDQTTPEGFYRVTHKLGPEWSKFHKALRLDYPNDSDRRRFEEGIRNGSISPASKIGGLIEIHGHGGRGVDWTDGCIALENADMDELFDEVPVGTPVAIVGTLAAHPGKRRQQ